MVSFIALSNERQGFASHGCKGGGQELVPSVFPDSLPRASGIQAWLRKRAGDTRGDTGVADC